MATFKEEFKKQRALKGSGATFEWNGGTYSTDTADGKKASPAKPAARPAGLNPKSGASRSTAGKVAPKESVSGASRSTAGKVKPKVDMPARPAGGAKAKQAAKMGATSSKVASNVEAEKRKPVAPKQSMGSRVMSASAKAGAAAGDVLKKILNK